MVAASLGACYECLVTPKQHWGLRITLLIVFALAFAYRASDAPLADEVDFTKPIHQWITDGPQRYGIWHSPLYTWLLMMVGTLAGDVTFPGFRMVGFFCVVGSALLMQAVMRNLRPDLSEGTKTAVWAASLLAPAALGSALILDFDNTLLLFGTAVFFWVLSREAPLDRSEGTPRLATFYGLAIALCFLGKETTPWFYPVGVLAAHWRTRGFWRSVGLSAASLAVAVVVAGAITWAWFKIYGLPMSSMFVTTSQVLRAQASSTDWTLREFLRVGWIKLTPALWLGIPVIGVCVWRTIRMLRTGGALAGICAVTLGVLVVYSAVVRQMTYHFPRYMAPVLLWTVVLVAVTELKVIARPRRMAWLWGIVAWFLAFPDPLATLYVRTPMSLLPHLAVFAIPVLLWLALRRWRIPFGVLSIYLSVGLGAAYAKSAFLNEGSIGYWYGETAVPDAREQIARWKLAHPDGRVISSIKDIAYASRDLGAEYLGPDEIAVIAEALCREPELLIVTRVREESGFERAPQLEKLRGCLEDVQVLRDIVVAQKLER